MKLLRRALARWMSRTRTICQKWEKGETNGQVAWGRASSGGDDRPRTHGSCWAIASRVVRGSSVGDGRGKAHSRGRWAWSVGLVVVGGIGVLVVVGCGGEKKPKSPLPETPPPPGAEAPPPPGAQGSPPGQSGPTPTEQKAEEKPKRPEKVEDWRRDDYFSAKREGDPRLVEALRYFGQKFVGKASAAFMLEELIQVETPPAAKPEEKSVAGGPPGAAPGMPPGPAPGMPPPEAIPPQGPGYMPGMPPGMGPAGQPQRFQLSQDALQMAIWALVINSTPESRQILFKILMGQIDTGMDRLATETALKTLATQANPENEAMLLAALIAPEKLRVPTAKEKPSGPTPGPGVPPVGPEMPPGGPGYGPGYGIGGEQVTAAWLQQISLELVKTYGSAALREKLAQYLMDPKVPLAVVERLGAFLWEPHPANLRAQLVLLQAPDTTEERRRKLLEYFMRYSADSLALVLGVPSGAVSGGPGMSPGIGPGFGPGFGMEGPGAIVPPAPGPMPGQVPGQWVPGGPAGFPPGVGAPGTPSLPGLPGIPGTGPTQPDPDLPYRTAAIVWGPEMQTYLGMALGKIDSLEEQAPVVVWAATVPTVGIRYQTFEVLKARWYDGPAGLQKAGFPNQWVCDPALLVAIKQLPRAKGFRSGTMPGMGSPGIGTPGVGTPGIGPPGIGPGGKPLPPGVRERLLKEQTEEDWLRVSGDLLLTMCQRFQQAGLQEIERARLERRRPDFKAPIQDLPLELHEPDLTPKPSYRVVLPGEVGKKLSEVGLAPTLIHYVRLEQKEKPSKVLAAYKKQLKTAKMYELPQMVWLDSLQPGRSEGLLRSIDVVISRAQTGTGAVGPGVGIPGPTSPRTPAAKDKEIEEPLVIQILVIELQDPSRDPNQPPPADKTPKEKASSSHRRNEMPDHFSQIAYPGISA